MFHVSSVRNRESIQAHGLDWTRMSGAWGIAGSRQPDVGGIFLSPDHFTAQFFVRMNNTGGTVASSRVLGGFPALQVTGDNCTYGHWAASSLLWQVSGALRLGCSAVVGPWRRSGRLCGQDRWG